MRAGRHFAVVAAARALHRTRRPFVWLLSRAYVTAYCAWLSLLIEPRQRGSLIRAALLDAVRLIDWVVDAVHVFAIQTTTHLTNLP